MILLKVSVIALVVVLAFSQSCNDGPVDIMVVLSSNATLDKSKFAQKLDVVTKFVNLLNIGRDNVRLGLITEYEFPDLEFNMIDHLDKPELSLSLKYTYFQGGTPSFGSGLKFIRENGMDGKLGGRPGAPNVVIFLTDGVPNDHTLAQTEAQKLTSVNTTVVTIGTDDVDKSDLVSMSSGCHYIAQCPPVYSASNVAEIAANLTCDVLRGVPVDDCECETVADVVFLFDASSDQGRDNFKMQVNLTQEIVSRLNVASNMSRVAAVTYSTHYHYQFGLDFHSDKADVLVALKIMPYQSDDGRNVEGGLEYISNNVFTPSISSRHHAKKVVVVFATGNLSDPDKARTEAERLKNDGATIISIGIGPGNNQELSSLATNSLYTKHFQSFSDLITGTSDLANLICQDKRLLTTSTPALTSPLAKACSGTSPCLNGGKCLEIISVKICVCPSNYSGAECQLPLTTATTNVPTTTTPTTNVPTTTVPTTTVPTTTVPTTTVPKTSGTTLNLCMTFNPCKNGGTCVIKGDMYECLCLYGFEGLQCQDSLNVTSSILTTTSASTSTPAPATTATTTTPVTTTIPVTTKTPVTTTTKISTTATVASTKPVVITKPSSRCPAYNRTRWHCDKAEVVFMIENGHTDVARTLDHEGDYIKAMIDNYVVDAQHVRVGVVAYSDTVQEYIHLDDDASHLKDRISVLTNGLLHPGGVVDFAQALDYVRQNSFSGARPGVPKIIISINQMQPAQLDTIPAAGDRLRDECINLYIQGIRIQPEYQLMLQQIVSKPSVNYYFPFISFTAMEISGHFYNYKCK